MTLALTTTDSVREKVRAETVRVEWEEVGATAVVDEVVFAATGKSEATVAQLEKDGRFRIRFKPGVEQGILTDQPVHVDVTLVSGAPVRFDNPEIALLATIPSRLTATATLLALVVLAVLGIAVVSRMGGSAAETIQGGLARSGSDPLRLDGFPVAYLLVSGDRLTATPDKTGDAWARVTTKKGKVWIEPLSGSVEIGGRPVEGRAELVEGTALSLGPIQATWVRRAAERALDEVDLTPRPRGARAADDEGGIDLGPPPKAKASPAPAAEGKVEMTEELPPPPPEEDDEEGISL